MTIEASLSKTICGNDREKEEIIPICFYPGGIILTEKKNSSRF